VFVLKFGYKLHLCLCKFLVIHQPLCIADYHVIVLSLLKSLCAHSLSGFE